LKDTVKGTVLTNENVGLIWMLTLSTQMGA